MLHDYNEHTTIEAVLAETEKHGYWVPACGGTETPISIKGYRLLYVWNPVTGSHAYLNLDTDIILSDDEMNAIFDCK